MEVFKKIWSYISLKKEENHPDGTPLSKSLKMMHGINKISIIMFLIGIIFVIYKLFLK